MIQHDEFQSNSNNQEILNMDSQSFPYLCNYAELNSMNNYHIPWHWHSELELDYVSEGEIEFQVLDTSVTLSKGSMVFINTDTMHDLLSKDHRKPCSVYAHIFRENFLSGMYNSLFEQKYLFPITRNKNLPYYVIRPDSYNHIRMIEKFLRIVELNREEPFGYEFEVRSELARIWCLLLEETKDLRGREKSENSIDITRLKTMMQYIHEHYMEKISVDDIAASANISSRECSRCFQRCTRSTPLHYLTDYRLRIAAQMLIQTDESILSISENCGFSSSSYLGKNFYSVMGCTPKEYRTKNRRKENE